MKSAGGLAGVAGGGAFDLKAKLNLESFCGVLPWFFPPDTGLIFGFSSSTLSSFEGRKGLSSSSLTGGSCSLDGCCNGPGAGEGEVWLDPAWLAG